MTSSLPLQALSDEVCAGPQLDPAAMREVAQAGFRSVVNNRPDFEGGPGQPTSQALEAAAREAGLAYAHVPVVPGQHTAQDLAQMTHLLATLPRPILLFCRSGARSGRLYQLATQG
jgi:uncharacterized protein (TIGR01244 family)